MQENKEWSKTYGKVCNTEDNKTFLEKFKKDAKELDQKPDEYEIYIDIAYDFMDAVNQGKLDNKNSNILDLDLRQISDMAWAILTTLSFLKQLIEKERNSEWKNKLQEQYNEMFNAGKLWGEITQSLELGINDSESYLVLRKDFEKKHLEYIVYINNFRWRDIK